MKRKLLAMVCAVSMIASLGAATVYASDDVKATGEEKIALITMDSIDQHWITLNEGAQEEAKELGVTVDFMSPNTKDDAQQIECVNNAVAGGYDAIMVALFLPHFRKQKTRELRSYMLTPLQMSRQKLLSPQTTKQLEQQQEKR